MILKSDCPVFKKSGQTNAFIVSDNFLSSHPQRCGRNAMSDFRDNVKGGVFSTV